MGKKDSFRNLFIVVLALIAVVVLEFKALESGVNGRCLSLAIGGICLLAGVCAKDIAAIVRGAAVTLLTALAGATKKGGRR